jgi:DNA-binding NtrC family response regulator
VEVTPAAMNCLMQYDWPGNVRELQNAIERALALTAQNVIDVDDLPPAIADFEPRLPSFVSAAAHAAIATLPVATDLEALERITIQRVFEQVRGDKVLAGKMLGISRATLYRKLKRYNIRGGAEALAN